MSLKLPSKNLTHEFPCWLALFTASALAAFPVLVFNGHGWYPSIDFFKWVLTFTVAGYGTGIAAFVLLGEKEGVQLTRIELAWLVLVLLAATQPMLLPLRSFHEWLRNVYFFAALGGAVFILRNLPIDKVLPGILRAITVTGGISALFGFAQNHLSHIRFPFILNTRGAPNHFLGNTGLDGIVGAYFALAIVAGLWLLIYTAPSHVTLTRRAAIWRGLRWSVINFAILSLNIAGIWRTATRSAFIACAAGCVTLLWFSRSQPGILKKCLKALAVVAVLMFCIALASPEILHVERRDIFEIFTPKMLSTANEGRWSIWLTTLEMIKSAPILGVGLGNYKWNYLDALAVSREAYSLSPRYTHWAHNEYLQWIAETGAIGGAFFFVLLIYCVLLCLKGMKQAGKRPFLVWCIAALAVLMSDSCFSRPLHHVDTAFTLSLALAMISRLEAASLKLFPKTRWGVSGVMLFVSLSGIILFSQTFQDQGYIGEYFYNPAYVTLDPSLAREKRKHPLLLEDAYLQLTARENYDRTLLDFGDAEQNELDAIRLLTQYFETQPRYEELNLLMLLYQKRQKRGDPEDASRYFKYYPPQEREKFLAGNFDGEYFMEDFW